MKTTTAPKSLHTPFGKSGGHSSNDKLIWATESAQVALKLSRPMELYTTEDQMVAMQHREF
jgi:hypothetical protein